MKKIDILCILLFTLISFTSFSQDTMVVQTLTYDSTGRNYVFTFPDDPVNSYEKILMEYSMRCKNGFISSGTNPNLGCGEWDYSCNTFITDPTRVDSNLVFHPSHIVSNFSGDLFEYTNQPSFTYYQYEQKEVNYTNVISETTASIGEGTTDVDLVNVAKMQFIYQQEELTNAGLLAGPISSLRLELNDSSEELSFLRIKLKHSTKTELDPLNPDLNGFQEVYFLDTKLDVNGPQQFNFYENFEWDGLSNILVEVSYTSGPFNAAGSSMKFHDTGYNASISSMVSDYSLDFSGAGRVEVPTEVFNTISDEITISLWCNGNPEVLPTNTTIFEGVDNDNIRQANVHLPWSNGQVYWDCGNDGGGYDRINKSANGASYEGQWNHWAFTKNANSGVMKIFLNGEEWHSGTGKNKLIDISKFNIGASSTFSNNYFGKIDEVRIWDKALDATTIKEWMNMPLQSSHPDYENLKAYYYFQEGTGNVTENIANENLNGSIIDNPQWNLLRGKDLYRWFNPGSGRANITFVQGEYELDIQTINIIDSVENALHTIREYGVDGSDLEVLNTSYVYPSGTMNTYNEAGDIVGTQEVASEGSIQIGEIEYYNKFDSKYEILSLVTPYGIGLNLGEGKTFTIDVSDYAPILRNDRRLSIELGGQNQEELDIKFLFIKGTPPRDVLDVQNVWPFRRGNFDPILADRVFEPRIISLNDEGSAYKIRSSITGHGQNGEFMPRTHYMNIEGGDKEFNYEVWKECADNPIYPQGGTWLFDRAGWCPGSATDVHEFDITDLIGGSNTVEVDYGLNGNTMTEANYLVSNQLVTYGAPNFNINAAIIDIKRPSTKVEYERINPACNTPIITIQNQGASPLTELSIHYGLSNGNNLTYEWTGNLAFMEATDITLPIDDINFWSSVEDQTEGIFEVSINTSSADEYPQNNIMNSKFELPKVITRPIQIFVQTNNRGNENSYKIKDMTGTVLFSRSNMENNTTYKDDIELTTGCYTFEFDDTGDDGLDYWYYGATGQNIGSGSVSLTQIIAPNVVIPFTGFDPEFGKSLRYDFAWGGLSTSIEPAVQSYFSVYPNPSNDYITVEMQGYNNRDISIDLYDLTGRLVYTNKIENNSQIELFNTINIAEYPSGLYYLKVFDGKNIKVRSITVQH